jgi:hypothetical protein
MNRHVVLPLGAMLLLGSVSMAPMVQATGSSTAINDFLVDNLGRNQQALPSVSHFDVSNIGPAGKPITSIVLVPASLLSQLSTSEIGRLQATLANGGTVLVWQDTIASVDPASVDQALGIPPLTDLTKPTPSSSGNVYAAGVAGSGGSGITKRTVTVSALQHALVLQGRFKPTGNGIVSRAGGSTWMLRHCHNRVLAGVSQDHDSNVTWVEGAGVSPFVLG